MDGMKYVVEVETDIRALFGPIMSIQEARTLSNRFIGRNMVKKVLIRTLEDPSRANLPSDPNQMRLEEHIADIHDAIV